MTVEQLIYILKQHKPTATILQEEDFGFRILEESDISDAKYTLNDHFFGDDGVPLSGDYVLLTSWARE